MWLQIFKAGSLAQKSTGDRGQKCHKANQMLIVDSRWEVNGFSLNISFNFFDICLKFFITKCWGENILCAPATPYAKSTPPPRYLHAPALADPDPSNRRPGTFDSCILSTWCLVRSRCSINICWLTNNCHFWNAKHRTQHSAYIISSALPLKPVSTGITAPILQMRKLRLREVMWAPKVTKLMNSRVGTQPTSIWRHGLCC